MAIENTYLLGKNITLGCGFDLQAKAPLDSRETVPAFAGLQALIDNNAAFEGMIVYDEETKKHYKAMPVDGVLSFRELGITEAELKELIASETTAAMEFKGVTTTLPTNPAKGDMYKVAGEDINIEIDGVSAIAGDSIVYNGEQWFLIPSGDDIEDTWRPVTGVDNGSTLTFVAGDKLEKTVAADGTITYKHIAIDAPANMNAEGDEPTRTYITQLIADNHGHIIGFKTATEVVEDTNTTYEFEGLPVGEDGVAPSNVYFQVKSSDVESPEVIYLDAYNKNEIDNKFNGLGTMAQKSADDYYTKDEVEGAFSGVTVTGIGDSTAAYVDFAPIVGDSTRVTIAGSNGLDVLVEDNTITINAFNLAEEIQKLQNAGYATVGKVEAAQAAAEAKAGELDAALKLELQGNIDGKVDKVDGKSLVDDDEIARLAEVDNYDDEEVRGLIGDNAKAIEDLETYVGTIPTDDKYKDLSVVAYINKKAEETLSAAQGGSSETAASVKQQLDNYKSENNTRVGLVEGRVTELETASATHATKDELNGVDAKFANYNTAAVQKGIDDAQDARIKKIEDDYLVEADIANFETKANVKKVADDLAGYIESNNAALAAETKARTDADAGFETRIAALEGNFGDGEGTVEAQIEAAVKTEEERAMGIEGGLRTDVDAIKGDYLKGEHKTALEGLITAEQQRAEGIESGLRTDVNAVAGRMDTAEGKITALETESAKHAIKTEVEGALALKADKSVVDAMYTNAQIDGFIADAKKYADDNDADTQYGIVYDSETKKIKLVSDVSKTEIDATDFIKDGMIESVELVQQDGEGNKGQFLKLTWNDDGKDVTYVPVGELVDVYTAEKNATEVQVAISNTNEVSATLVNDGVTEAKLAEGVRTKLNKTWEEVGVAKGLVDALEGGQVKANKEAIEAINDADNGILAQAKEYADGLADNYATKEQGEKADGAVQKNQLGAELYEIASTTIGTVFENNTQLVFSFESKDENNETLYWPLVAMDLTGENHIVLENGEHENQLTISTDITDATAEKAGLVTTTQITDAAATAKAEAIADTQEKIEALNLDTMSQKSADDYYTKDDIHALDYATNTSVDEKLYVDGGQQTVGSVVHSGMECMVVVENPVSNEYRVQISVMNGDEEDFMISMVEPNVWIRTDNLLKGYKSGELLESCDNTGVDYTNYPLAFRTPKYAEKAKTYTKDEVDALLSSAMSWGEF